MSMKLTLIMSTTLVMVASAVQAEDDRFKPRTYGSTAVVAAQYSPGVQAMMQSSSTEAISSQTTVENSDTGFVRRIVEADQGIIMSPAKIDTTIIKNNNVVKAQYVKLGDVSDAEHKALLEEASRIRAYQSSKGQYSGISAEAVNADTQPVYEIELFAPATPEVKQAEIAPQTSAHTVQKGDTLYNISKRYNVTVDELKTKNGLKDNTISLGQVIIISSAANSLSRRQNNTLPMQTTLVRNVEPVPTQSGSIYAVLPKDTLYAISRRSCVSVGDIIATNGITDPGAIKPGQRLVMPSGHCLGN